MAVRLVIAKAKNSSTQKIWGMLFPLDALPLQGNAAIFYGPGTKFGGSVYVKPTPTAISVYNKKIRGDYRNIHQSDFNTDAALEHIAARLLRGIQGGGFVPTIIESLKPADPIPDPIVPKSNSRISAAMHQVPTLPWAF